MRAIVLVCCLAVGALAENGGDGLLLPGRFNRVDGAWSAHIHPEVQNAMADIYASQMYGKTKWESSFVVHGYRADLTPVIRPIPQTAEIASNKFDIIVGDTAIVHTHPDRDDPRPSQSDMDIATKYGLDMYTVTSRGVFLYRTGMKQPMLVIDRDTFLNIVKARQKEKTASRHGAASLVAAQKVK